MMPDYVTLLPQFFEKSYPDRHKTIIFFKKPIIFDLHFSWNKNIFVARL
jgi:hypothetical protein